MSTRRLSGIVGVGTVILMALLWLFAFNCNAFGGVREYSDSSVTSSWFLNAPIAKAGWTGKIDSAHAHVMREDIGDNAVSISRLSAATDGDADSGWVSRVLYAGDSIYIFRDALSDWIDVDVGATPDTGYSGYYEILVTLFADGEPTTTVLEFRWLRTAPLANVTYWDGTAAATADDGWVTSDGDTNTTTGITYAADQRAAIGDTNSTTGITYAVDQRAAIGDTNAFDLGDTLTQILAAVDSTNAAIADANKANFKATGFSTLTTSDNIGINWADIDNPTTAVDLSATTIRSTDSTLQIGADGLDAAAIKADAITNAKVSSDVLPDAIPGAGGGLIVYDAASANPLKVAAAGQVYSDVIAISGSNLAADTCELRMLRPDEAIAIADSALLAIADANKPNFKATGFSTLTESSNIGINWGDVTNPTTVIGLSGTTIKASTDTETDIAALKDFDPASDSVLVDGSAFASQEGIIDAPHFTDSARHMIANRADSGSVSSGLDSAAVDVIVSVVVSDSNLARDITKDDYKAASGTGSSGVRCSVFVEESDHTPVTGVRIWLYNETKTSISYVNDNAGSNAAGYSIFQIPVDEIVYAQASRPGWNYDSATTYQYMDVGSGSDFYDTIPMTEIATPTGDSAAMCMLYGYVENGFGVKLPDVTIMVEMYLDEPGRERDNVMILKGVDYWTSNATGYFEGYVERSDSVSYASGNKMVVQFTIDGNKLDEQFAIPDTTQYEFVRLIVPDPD